MQNKRPKTAEDMANALCGDNVYDIEGVADIDYPIELNAFIIVMDDGKKYLVEVSEYTNDD